MKRRAALTKLPYSRRGQFRRDCIPSWQNFPVVPGVRGCSETLQIYLAGASNAHRPRVFLAMQLPGYNYDWLRYV
jgi:hypothetical protein